MGKGWDTGPIQDFRTNERNLSKRSNAWNSGGENFARGRAPPDKRRIFYQSLATENKGEPLPFEKAKVNARKRAFRFPDGDDVKIFAHPNFDEDGDEMYHDLVDVLYGSLCAC